MPKTNRTVAVTETDFASDIVAMAMTTPFDADSEIESAAAEINACGLAVGQEMASISIAIGERIARGVLAGVAMGEWFDTLFERDDDGAYVRLDEYGAFLVDGPSRFDAAMLRRLAHGLDSLDAPAKMGLAASILAGASPLKAARKVPTLRDLGLANGGGRRQGAGKRHAGAGAGAAPSAALGEAPSAASGEAPDAADLPPSLSTIDGLVAAIAASYKARELAEIIARLTALLEGATAPAPVTPVAA